MKKKDIKKILKNAAKESKETMKEFDLDKYLKKVAETAEALADAGKTQAKLIDAQNKLGKAERQLGALVYSLAKAGESNEELVAKYIENLDELNTTIETLKAEMEPIKAQADNVYNAAKDMAMGAYENVKAGVASIRKDAEAVETEIVEDIEEAEEAVEEAVEAVETELAQDAIEAAEAIETAAEEVVEAAEEVIVEAQEAPAVEEGKHCPHCGAEVQEDELFCNSCGNQL